MKSKWGEIIRGMSNEAYHGDASAVSSSQLKTILKDPEIYHKSYVTKELERETTSSMDVGTYFHTSVLEPGLVESTCAVFSGIRRGSKWEAFLAANPGKTIITDNELESANRLIGAVKKSPVAMGYLSKGEAEVSAFLDLFVVGECLFTSDGKWVLGRNGWERNVFGAPSKGRVSLRVKARADLLGKDYILDLKSTSSNCKDARAMRNAVSEYSYDLSAAMYLDIFSSCLGERVSDFIWVFASKEFGTARSYRATPDNILIGRAKWKKAALELARYVSSDWAFVDTLEELSPNNYELEWIREKETDLL